MEEPVASPGVIERPAMRTDGAPIWPQPSRAAQRLMRVPPVLYRIGLARQAGKRFLLLTTTGRRSGRPHTCALNYVRDKDEVYVFAGRGPRADWYRNAMVTPDVRVQLGEEQWVARATPIADPRERVRLVERLIEEGDRAGPPRPLRQLFKRLGFDYDAEIRKAAGLAPHMPILALRRAGAQATPVRRKGFP